MWIATWALNTLVAKGKTTDWQVHMIGQAIGGFTDATHGMTLSAVSLAYYRTILDAGLPKFRRFAVNVWKVDDQGKNDREVALEGLSRMEAWMKSMKLAMKITDLGVTREMIPEISRAVLPSSGGYHQLNVREIERILEDSL